MPSQKSKAYYSVLESVKTVNVSELHVQTSKLADYGALTKLRLSSLVIFSAVMGYLIGNKGHVDFLVLLMLIVGGWLVTAGSNGINQYIERDLDKLMDRTRNRPMPAGRMKPAEGLTASLIMGLTGSFLLWYFVNPLSGYLSFVSLLLYTIVYTPLKRVTPLSVFVGAVPGAMPILLGWVAARGEIGLEAWILYSIQFIWQFPHFWAIAWILNDDYLKAGFKMLPSPGGRDKSSAFQTLVYTFCLIPLGLLPQFFGLNSWVASLTLIICGIIFMIPAIKLYRDMEMKQARKLMFGSFIYLPVTQIIMMLDKILIQ